MRRYELIDGPSQKFWEITLQEDRITRRWGRLGSKGQSNVKTYPDEHRAKRAWEELIAKKVSKGYKLVDESPELGASGAGVSTEPRNPELEQMIFDSPDERDGYLVLGDWLMDQGSPRGELIAANARMVDQNDPVEFLRFKKVQEKLLAENPDLFYGPTLKRYTEFLRLTWMLGFWRTLEVRGDYQNYLPDDIGALITSVAQSPSALFLREIELTLRFVDHDRLAGCLDGLADHPMRALSSLDIAAQNLDGVHVVAGACPALRHLGLDVDVLSVGPEEWSMPTLRSLKLRLRETSSRDVARLLDKLAAPGLENLDFSTLSDEQCELVLSSPLAPTLKTLELDWNSLGQPALHSFIANHHRLPELTALRLSIVVEPGTRDSNLERQFRELYPFADLTVGERDDRYDENGE